MTKHNIICSSVILVFALITPGFADEHFPFLGEITKDSVNLRAGPNTNFAKVDKLNKGVDVVVLGRSYEWYKIQPLPTTQAYIRSDYLKTNEGQAFAVISGNNVNIRCSPNSNADSLGEVKKGTLVKILEQVGETSADQKTGNFAWCRLAPVAGTAVWIYQDFVKEISSQVPSSLLIAEIQWPEDVSFKNSNKEVVEKVSLQGILQPLAQSPSGDVHYEIVMDDKSVFYLRDIPPISFFANTLVTIEAAVIPDPHKKFTYPLLAINKIALVL